MQVEIRGRNGGVPPNLKQYAQKKVTKLSKYFHRIQSVEMEQALERGQYIIELSVVGDGVFLRSEDRSNDMLAAVDSVVSKMETQVKRYKTRLRHGHQRPGPIKEVVAEALEVPPAESEDGEPPFAPRIGRRKRFQMKPMSPEEAAQQMELTDHDFFLFHNQETGAVNLLYRRRGGDYGLIEPEA